GQVDLEDFAPGVHGIVGDGGVGAGDACAGDENVHRAETLLGLGEGGGDAGLVGDVDGDADTAQRRGGVRGAAPVPKRDARARLHHAMGDGVPDAAGAAGDDGDAILEVDLVHAMPLPLPANQRLLAPLRRRYDAALETATGARVN